MSFLSCQRGQSLLEVIVALAIFALIAAAMIALSVGGFASLNQGGQQTVAVALVTEGLEAVRSIRDRAWNELIFTTSSVSTSTGAWTFTGENTTQNIGPYLRTISFSPVCRDVGSNLATCPASYTDLYTKLVNVAVDWSPRPNATNTVRQSGYLSNWDSKKWMQTDWSGGNGQSVWLASARYDNDSGSVDVTSTPGQITLKSQSTLATSTYDWAFTTSTDYVYNASKITVASGQASLVDQGTGGNCSGTATACVAFFNTSTCQAQQNCLWGGGAAGNTLNPNFTSNANSWTYADWETGNKVNGTWSGTGGNPAGRILITVTGQKNVTISGYWRQAFTIIQNNVTAFLNFDWRVPTYSATAVNSFRIYAFVENSSGAPVIGNEVWSTTVTGASNWVKVSNFNVSAKVATAGTYYLKFVVRIIFNNKSGTPGINIGSFDNAQLSWTYPSFCSGTAKLCNTFGSSGSCAAQNGCSWSSQPAYPTDSPTINPVLSLNVSGLEKWLSFTEIATKNGGEIYYQLSSDNGSTWQYWDGGAWSLAEAGNYSTADIINSNISTFTTSTGEIKFKAFLSSNGSQQVSLDNVNLAYVAASGGAAYSTSGYLISSAYNMSDNSPVQILEWDQDLSSCPTCNIQLQLRVAPDASGSPGTWSGWYGAAGVGTYYTNPLGTLLSAALNGKQWVQYRAELTGPGTGTPILKEVRIDYK